MLDNPVSNAQRGPKTSGPRLDLQQHLADLEAAGLLIRIDRPINKDTELILAGALAVHRRHAEDQRRAFLFTCTSSTQRGPQIRHGGGRGACFVASDLCVGMGRSWSRSARPGWRRSPIRSRRSPPTTRLKRGHHRRGAEVRRAEGAAGAGVDAGLRCRALSHGDAVRHPRSGDWRPQHGHLSRSAESGRPRGGAHGGPRGDGGGRLFALAEISRAQGEDADCCSGRRRAHRAAPPGLETLRTPTWTRWRWQGGAAGEAIRRTRAAAPSTLDAPADLEIVVEGLIDCDVLEPGRAVRREQRLCRA